MTISLSRRTFLNFAAAGSAATLPAVALAGATAKRAQLPQLSDEQQLAACIEQAKTILLRMHPDCDDVFGDGYTAHRVGGATIEIGVRRPRVEWSGDGMYEIEDRHGRYLEPLWIIREWSDMDRRHYLIGANYFDGDAVLPKETVNPARIVRKLGGSLS